MSPEGTAETWVLSSLPGLDITPFAAPSIKMLGYLLPSLRDLGAGQDGTMDALRLHNYRTANGKGKRESGFPSPVKFSNG